MRERSLKFLSRYLVTGESSQVRSRAIQIANVSAFRFTQNVNQS